MMECDCGVVVVDGILRSGKVFCLACWRERTKNHGEILRVLDERLASSTRDLPLTVQSGR